LIAVLLNPKGADVDVQRRDIDEAARAVGQPIYVLNASSERDIHAAFETLPGLKAGGLLVGANPFFNSRREQIVTLSVHYRIPAIYEVREYAVAGGLLAGATCLIRAAALQAYLGHKNIQHTVRYTELSPTRFKDFWRG
jgi:putative ABC transport system substrate-binding protein